MKNEHIDVFDVLHSCTPLGLKKDMEHLEKEFIKGTYTPLSNTTPMVPPPTPNRKRSRNGMVNSLHVCCTLHYCRAYSTGNKENLKESKRKGQGKRMKVVQQGEKEERKKKKIQ